MSEALKIQVTSAAHTVNAESGVVFTVSSGDAAGDAVKVQRASGRQLQVVGVLHSLILPRTIAGVKSVALSGRRTIARGSTIDALVSPEVLGAVQEVCTTGQILFPEAGSSLEAVAALVGKYEAEGVTVTFRAGAPVLTASQSEAFEAVVRRAALDARKHAARMEAWSLPPEDAAWVERSGATVVYTDGSLSPKTGFSSWAWYVDAERSSSGTVAAATSSYAERRAAVEALKSVPGPVLLVTDLEGLVPRPSAKVVSGKERTIIRTLRRLVGSGQVRVLTVKGHAYCPGNVAVDALAGEALDSTWARISADPVLRDRLVMMYEESRSNLQAARRLANERRQEHMRRYPPGEGKSFQGVWGIQAA